MAVEQSELESYLTTSLGRTLPDMKIPDEANQKAEALLKRVRIFKTIEAPAKIPVLRALNPRPEDTYPRVKKLDIKLQQLPGFFEGQALADPFEQNPPEDILSLLALARTVGTIPRKIPDNYIYRSPSPENTSGQEIGHLVAVYNVFHLKQGWLPDHTYWHEAFIADGFSSYLNLVVITVNKDFRAEAARVALVGNLRNLFKRFF